MIVAKHWVVDCQSCHARRPAKTYVLALGAWTGKTWDSQGRIETFPLQARKPRPDGTFYQSREGYCDSCGNEASIPILIRAKSHADKPAEKCGAMCREARGDSCYCECEGASHGLGSFVEVTA